MIQQAADFMDLPLLIQQQPLFQPLCAPIGIGGLSQGPLS